jgi:hypothetical protein
MEDTRVVLDLFDSSAHPYVQFDVLKMAFLLKKIARVIGSIEQSILITKT